MANQQKGNKSQKAASEENQDNKTINEENTIDIEAQSKNESSDNNITIDSQSKKNDTETERSATIVEDKKSVKPDTVEAGNSVASSPSSGQKKSPIFGIVWPIITGVAAAGGVIFSQNMWLKDVDQNSNIDNNIAGLTQSINDQQQYIDQLNLDLDTLRQQAKENIAADAKEVDMQQLLSDQTSEVEALKQTLSDQQASYETLAKQYEQVQAAWQDLNSQYGRINAQVEGTISQIQALSTSLDSGTTPEISNQLAALETSRRQSVQALEAQIANLTQTLNDVRSQQPAFEIFDRRVNQLEGDVTVIKENVGSINQKIDQDLKQLSEDMQQTVSASNALVQFDALEQAVLSGSAYDVALGEFKIPEKIDIDGEIFSALKQNQQGIMKISQLKSQFNDLARNLVVTARKAEAQSSNSKAKSLLSNFNELVTVTRNDGGEQGSIDRLIYDVKIALDAEDLGQVLALFESGQAEVQNEAKSWLSEIKNRQDTLEALQQLKLKLLASA